MVTCLLLAIAASMPGTAAAAGSTAQARAPMQPAQQQWCAAQQAAARMQMLHARLLPNTSFIVQQLDVHTCQSVMLPAAKLAALADQGSSIVAAAVSDGMGGAASAEAAGAARAAASTPTAAAAPAAKGSSSQRDAGRTQQALSSYMREFALLECDGSLWAVQEALRSPDLCTAHMDTLLLACAQW